MLGARRVLVSHLFNLCLFFWALLDDSLDLRIKATIRGVVRSAFKFIATSQNVIFALSQFLNLIIYEKLPEYARLCSYSKS